MGLIRIKDLSLRVIVGINDDERIKKQDILINVEAEIDMTRAIKSDRIEDTFDYKMLTKKILDAIEPSKFFLIETLADTVLQIVMADARVVKARVEVDKPFALRYARSVSVEVFAERKK